MAKPDQLKQLYKLAKTAYERGREPAAFELLRVYLKQCPNHDYARLMFGDCLRLMYRGKEAERALLNALEIAPRKYRYAVQARLGMLERDRGRFQDAERWFSKACKSKYGKDLGWKWVLRGANLLNAGRLKLAEKCLKRAILLKHVDLDEAYSSLGKTLRAQGKYREARAAFRRSVKIDPACKEAKEDLASLDGIDTARQEARTWIKRS